MAATEITTRLSAPYSAICYVESEWNVGSNVFTSRASAVVVGINDVLTALHVVYQSKYGGWATKVTIIPGADTSPISRPFGTYTDIGSMVGRAPDWDPDPPYGLLSQAESAGDMALLGLKSRIGDKTGVVATTNFNGDFYGQVVGYPAGSQNTGMMSAYVYADSNSAGVFHVGSGLGAGASGGPLLYTANGTTAVAGVLSSGNGTSASTYAGLFGAGSYSWLQSAIAANDYLVGASATPATSVTTSSGIIFTGGSGADELIGGSGLDSFTGNAGNDSLDGGAGIDTANFTGPRSNYTISFSGSTITVSDSVAFRDGADTLINIERVKFSDVSLAFDTSGNGGMAYRLYKAAFDRVPDTAGLGFQMNALDGGLSLGQVAANFIASPEFVRTYGSLTNTQFVNQLYVNVLDRAGDSAGVAYHLARLDGGAAGRNDVLAGFSESPENQAALIGTISTGMVYTV